MLCGKPPFYHDTKEGVYEAIKRNQLDMDTPSWQNVSPEAKNFVARALVKDPKYRASAQELLEHEWLNDTHKPQRNELKLHEVSENIKTFYSASGFQKTVVSILAGLRV
jgi:serine/threonine protein kinase